MGQDQARDRTAEVLKGTAPPHRAQALLGYPTQETNRGPGEPVRA